MQEYMLMQICFLFNWKYTNTEAIIYYMLLYIETSQNKTFILKGFFRFHLAAYTYTSTLIFNMYCTVRRIYVRLNRLTCAHDWLNLKIFYLFLCVGKFCLSYQRFVWGHHIFYFFFYFEVFVRQDLNKKKS